MTKRWIYRPQEHDDWGIVRDADRDDSGFHRVICQANYVASPDELTAHRINGTDPAEANARLIAAAPDLLAVCKDIEGFLKRSGYDTALVRAAIAKAEGRA